MTTGKRHVLLSRNVGLGQKKKAPSVCQGSLLRYRSFFLASLLWKGRASHRKLRHSDSARNQHFLQKTVLYWKNNCSEDERGSCTMVRGKTCNSATCKHFGFYTNCEHRPALPSVCWANVHTAGMQAGDLRSSVYLHHLLLSTESLQRAWAALLWEWCR